MRLGDKKLPSRYAHIHASLIRNDHFLLLVERLQLFAEN
jgi:hypothetical protein